MKVLDLSGLRIASFRSNRLSNSCLADLGASCPLLEELCLEGNHLSNLSELWQADESLVNDTFTEGGGGGGGLPSRRLSRDSGAGWFRNLRKLDCGHNDLTSLDDLNKMNKRGSLVGASLGRPLSRGGGCLDRLSQLSLESNRIKSLAPLRNLVSLMELYMGNNDVSELHEIDSLKVQYECCFVIAYQCL